MLLSDWLLKIKAWGYSKKRKADGDDEFPKPQRLQWNVDNVLREQISLAKFHMDK